MGHSMRNSKKNTKMADFGNMRNQIFVPDFLFSFYIFRESVGTPLQTTSLLQFFASLVVCVTKV